MSKELLNFLILRDSEGDHHVWSKQEYEKYIRACVSVSAGSGFKIITCFNGDEDYLMDDPLPLSREQGDPSVLVEALEYLVKDVRNKPWDTRYATALKKADEALTTYKESKPSPSITREQASQIWDQAIESFCYDNGSEFVEGKPPSKSEYLKQFDKQ